MLWPPTLSRLTTWERPGPLVLERAKTAFRPKTGAVMRRALSKLRLPPASMGTGGAPEVGIAAEAGTSRAPDAAKRHSALNLKRANRASKDTPPAPDEADIAAAQRRADEAMQRIVAQVTFPLYFELSWCINMTNLTSRGRLINRPFSTHQSCRLLCMVTRWFFVTYMPVLVQVGSMQVQVLRIIRHVAIGCSEAGCSLLQHTQKLVHGFDRRMCQEKRAPCTSIILNWSSTSSYVKSRRTTRKNKSIYNIDPKVTPQYEEMVGCKCKTNQRRASPTGRAATGWLNRPRSQERADHQPL